MNKIIDSSISAVINKKKNLNEEISKTCKTKCTKNCLIYLVVLFISLLILIEKIVYIKNFNF